VSTPGPRGLPEPMALATMLLPSCLLTMAGATFIGDMFQGAAFTQCVTISDYQTKTLSDDITLQDRDTNGCCPAGTVPGVKFYANYQGAQIVCGIEDDGNYAMSTSTSNGVSTCTYNNCYVMKQNITCSDDSKQFLNGCCAGTTTTNTGFPSGPAGCSNYFYSSLNVHSESFDYCVTYATHYDELPRVGTTSHADDQYGGVLEVSNIDTYAACWGSMVGNTPRVTAEEAAALAAARAGSAATAAAAPTLLAALAVVGAQLA